MSMKLEMFTESGILYVEATGTFSLEYAQITFVEMLEEVVRSKAKKVLFDGRKVRGNPLTIERFYYGKFAARAVSEFSAYGLASITPFAYVLEVPLLDRKRFGETVAVNRGMNVKAFDNRDEALGWLGQH